MVNYRSRDRSASSKMKREPTLHQLLLITSLIVNVFTNLRNRIISCFSLIVLRYDTCVASSATRPEGRIKTEDFGLRIPR